MSRYRNGEDRLSFPCPACGAPEGYPCTPLRESRFPTVLEPHWQRGLTPHEVNIVNQRRKRVRA